jgi:hypothetical protein
MNRSSDFIAMLIDSEDPAKDVEKTWAHVRGRDKWVKPKGTRDDQVLLMTTCMETWIVADRGALTEHYGKKLQESALPALVNLEDLPRQTVQGKLARATRDCSNAYAKGKRSFDLLAKLNPEVLQDQLPSFARMRRVLQDRL